MAKMLKDDTKVKYIQTETSLVFPNLNIQEIPSLIERYRMAGRRVFRQVIREWVRGQMV